jgi:hypothetical protein
MYCCGGVEEGDCLPERQFGMRMYVVVWVWVCVGGEVRSFSTLAEEALS